MPGATVRSLPWLSEQRGSAEAVGFLGALPLVLAVMLGVLQMAVFAHTLVVAEVAARNAVRAAAARRSVTEAVQRVERVTRVDMTPSVTCPPGEGYVILTLTARVPALFGERVRRADLFSVNRTVVMPREGNCP